MVEVLILVVDRGVFLKLERGTAVSDGDPVLVDGQVCYLD